MLPLCLLKRVDILSSFRWKIQPFFLWSYYSISFFFSQIFFLKWICNYCVCLFNWIRHCWWNWKIQKASLWFNRNWYLVRTAHKCTSHSLFFISVPHSSSSSLCRFKRKITSKNGFCFHYFLIYLCIVVCSSWILGSTIDNFLFFFCLFDFHFFFTPQYVSFGSEVSPDILLSYDPSSIGAAVGRICISFTVTTAFPINIFPARLALGSLITGKDQLSNLLFYSITFGLFSFCLVVALFVPGINVVFGVIGSLLAVWLIFIFPSLFAWKTRDEKSFHTILAIVFMIFGVFIGISGTTITIYNIVHK